MKYPYLTCADALPESIPYPVFLEQTQLSTSARLMYCILLGKSLEGEQTDSEGRRCVSASLDELSLLLVRSRSTVKRLLRELEDSGLLERSYKRAQAEMICYFRCPSHN